MINFSSRKKTETKTWNIEHMIYIYFLYGYKYKENTQSLMSHIMYVKFCLSTQLEEEGYPQSRGSSLQWGKSPFTPNKTGQGFDHDNGGTVQSLSGLKKSRHSFMGSVGTCLRFHKASGVNLWLVHREHTAPWKGSEGRRTYCSLRPKFTHSLSWPVGS